MQHLDKIIFAEEGDPMKSLTCQASTLKPILFQTQPGVKGRIGKPKIKGVQTILESLWKLIGQTTGTYLKGAIMNLDKEEHLEAIKEAAKTHISNEFQ